MLEAIPFYTGNDVINLKESLGYSKHKNISWIKKVFNPNEQAHIFQSDNPNLTLWQLWSCKESAYKVFVKLGRKRFLNALKISIDVENYTQNKFEINYMNWKLFTNSQINSNYIHSVSSTCLLKNLDQGVFKFQGVSLEKGSRLIRSKIKDHVFSEYGKKIFSFSKNHLQIPIANTKDNSTIDISISHDEPYFAYTIFL